MVPLSALGLLLALCLTSAADKVEKPAAAPVRKPDASDAFFSKGTIPHLKIELGPKELQQLRQNPREYVRATVIEEKGKRYADVGIHVKGAAGSFRAIDDRPALTLNFDKFDKKQKFHDIDKLHLNNSVQDGSYLCELLCSELFLANGTPTPRVTHARVWLNGRDLGFYVLKEGFDATFLRRHFKDATGNLYDGGFLREIDADLVRQTGQGPADRSDLKALVAACRESDPARRWQRIAEKVDVDRFLTFMALELMTCHWDGYCQNRNNYRVYFDPATGKAHFFPHGLDQMFGDPNFNVLHVPGGLMAQTIMQNPEWRAQYRERLNSLMPQFVPADKLLKRIDEVQARMRPVLAAINMQAVRDQENHARDLKSRIQARARSLEQQNAVPEPKPLRFDADGIAVVKGWQPRRETEDARLEQVSPTGEPASLWIRSGRERCVASWRAKVLLPGGHYRLEGQARTQDVKSLREQMGAGAGLRLSGMARNNKIEGTSDWQKLSHEFTISQPMQEVELVAELRSQGGQAWFETGSLRIVKVGK